MCWTICDTLFLSQATLRCTVTAIRSDGDDAGRKIKMATPWEPTEDTASHWGMRTTIWANQSRHAQDGGFVDQLQGDQFFPPREQVSITCCA